VTTRTYHPRQGRVSARHRAALDDLWPKYGVAAVGALDATALFGRDLPLVLEIGSGMGEATVAMAAADPDRGYLAAEIHRPGLGNLLALVDDAGLANVRVINGDALLLLEHHIAPASLDAIHAFFPDPWPKARHHKRRLIRPDRLALLVSRLRDGGMLHIATDDAGYATAMLAAADDHAELLNPHHCLDRLANSPNPGFAPRPRQRPETRFERRGLDAGRTIYDLVCHVAR
jgi:tRNA (guanine-N7-)-methyltransferase